MTGTSSKLMCKYHIIFILYTNHLLYNLSIPICPNVWSRNQTSCAQNDVCNNIIAISFIKELL